MFISGLYAVLSGEFVFLNSGVELREESLNSKFFLLKVSPESKLKIKKLLFLGHTSMAGM